MSDRDIPGVGAEELTKVCIMSNYYYRLEACANILSEQVALAEVADFFGTLVLSKDIN